MNFREALKARRIELGMSQRDLARAMEVTQTAVSQWERGETRPYYKTSAKLSKVLGVKERDLLYPQDETEENEDNKNVP